MFCDGEGCRGNRWEAGTGKINKTSCFKRDAHLPRVVNLSDFHEPCDKETNPFW